MKWLGFSFDDCKVEIIVYLRFFAVFSLAFSLLLFMLTLGISPVPFGTFLYVTYSSRTGSQLA